MDKVLKIDNLIHPLYEFTIPAEITRIVPYPHICDPVFFFTVNITYFGEFQYLG